LSGWVSEKDRGQAEAINKGLAKATGEIVAWLNSDDIYLPGAIESGAKALMDAPKAGLVFGDALAIDADGQVTNQARMGDWTLEDLMQFKILWQPAVFIRRDMLEKAGLLEPDYHLLLDHQLWLRIAELAPVLHMPKLLAAARFHEAAKNVARAADFGQEALRIVEWMSARPALRERFTRLERRIWAGAYRFKGRYLLDGGMPWPALKSYGKALGFHPPTALVEWHRMVYAVLCLLGLNRLKQPYLALRKRFHPVPSALKTGPREEIKR
jgi:glycosyltransferase involved in cell wall biosynthesis